MKVSKLTTLIVSALLLTGCTSIGTHILSNPKIYLSDSGFQNIDLKRFDIEKNELCILSDSECIKYLYAISYQPEEFPEHANVHYTIDATGNGVTNNFTYKAAATTFNRVKGTAILFHGFGASKEAMLALSIYFRSIGMDIIAVDLFGHGESTRDFALGAKEHEVFSSLISEINAKQALVKPVIAVGHSMGALTAAKISLDSKIVDGAILLAPMIQFDDAAEFYLAYKSPMLNKMFSEHMGEIVSAVMEDKSVSPLETNTSLIIKETHKPTLIFNSDVDTVSPAEQFTFQSNDVVQTEVLTKRSHSSLIAFDVEDAKTVEEWLMKNLAIYSHKRQ